MTHRYLITGASGFLGGHLAEACVARGHPVSAITRNSSKITFLEQLGVSIFRSELKESSELQSALSNVDVVVHCAAKVGDTGPVKDYRAINVEGLRALLKACQGRPLHRFIHMSSLGVYEARHHYGTDEAVPLPASHIDAYTQTKVEAERLLSEYRHQGFPFVVLRPGFIYGPRDRTVMPKIIEKLATGRMHFLGGDQRILNTVYVKNVLEAAFLAAEKTDALGQIYNLTDGESVTRQRFMDAIAGPLGLKKPKQILPRWLAALVAAMVQRQIRRAGADGTARLTHAQYKFLLLNLDFSIEKARRELGYGPKISFDEGIRETMKWYKENI